MMIMARQDTPLRRCLCKVVFFKIGDVVLTSRIVAMVMAKQTAPLRKGLCKVILFSYFKSNMVVSIICLIFMSILDKI